MAMLCHGMALTTGHLSPSTSLCATPNKPLDHAQGAEQNKKKKQKTQQGVALFDQYKCTATQMH